MSGHIPARAISASTATPSSRPTSSRRPYPLGWPTGIHFIQPEFEAMLRSAVARHGNVECCSRTSSSTLPTWATAPSHGQGFGPGADPLDPGATFLARDCNSFVRRKLGISYEDLAFDEWWIVVDAAAAATALPEMNAVLLAVAPASAIAARATCGDGN
jgi:2-polyprenyl-6-methoxyphenol hydroxylase-like FAD-dependent oxidoreductase